MILKCNVLCFVIFRIILRVRKLLLLIPTDPEVQDALDNFVPKESSVWSHQVCQTFETCVLSSPCLFLFNGICLTYYLFTRSFSFL